MMNTVLLNDRITKQEKVTLVANLIENKDIIKTYGSQMEVVIMVLEAQYSDDDLVAFVET